MRETVIHFTDSADFGGAEQALLHLLSGLDRQRWRPILLHHDEVGLAPLLQGAQQLEIERQAVPRLPLGKQGLQLIPTFVRRLRALQPALFHAHLTWPLACKYGLISAVLARVPAIVATAQLFVELPYTYATRLQQRLLTVGMDRYLAVSQATAQAYQKTFWLPAHKVQVIHNAIPIECFQRPSVTSKETISAAATSRPVILTTARLDQQKGHPYLLKAAAQVPEATFLLVGQGVERAPLEAQARALGVADRVHFLGQRHDIPDLLAGCDLFVLPSLYEGLPLAVLEAMAAGKPVITSDIAGTREAVVHGATGLLVPPADSNALAAAIGQLLANPAQAQQLAKAGQERVQQEFSVQRMVQKVTALYDELLHPCGGRHESH